MQEVEERARNVSRLKVTNTGPQGGSAGAKERCVECNRLLGLRSRRDRAKSNAFRLCFACRASPPESYYCNGTTTTGTTCRRIRDKDSDFCSWHR